MLDRSNPICFAATENSARTHKFYQETLGLKFVSGDQFALVFDVNGIMLRIQKVDKVNPHSYTTLGWNVADIKKAVTELSGRGVKFMKYEGMNQDESGIWTSPDKAKIAWFKDPDGNLLSLTEF
jgi:predicted enzyme related to lactoylglutathione lyase